MSLTSTHSQYEDGKRIVAIGDLHGNYGGFQRILRWTGVIDENLHWQARGIHLVQMGDIVGKGGEPGKIFCLLRRLEREALAANSQVHCLLGNHEVMCLLGANSYVTQEEYGGFNDGSIETSFGGRSALVSSLSAAGGVKGVKGVNEPCSKNSQGHAAASVPPSRYTLGLYPDENSDVEDLAQLAQEDARAFKRLLSPFGPLGRWLMQRNSVMKIGETLFVHGGLGRTFGLMPMDDVNLRVRREVLKYRHSRKESDVLGVEGPMWYRRLVQERTPDSERELEDVLRYHDCQRMVVGHTPTHLIDKTCKGRIVELYGGKLICIDTGIGKSFGERLGALCIENGDVQAWYPAEETVLAS